MNQYWGELAGLSTALLWALTGISFEFASKRIGSLQVNIIRLFLAFFLLGSLNLIRRGMFLPMDATSFNWTWLIISGIVGFTIGDLLLFKAFEIIGARISLLIMSLSPPIAAIISFFFLGETLAIQSILGMLLTISGVSIVILERKKKSAGPEFKKVKSKYSIAGLLFAFGGSIGQAVGIILSKYGMRDYDAFASSQIRVIAGFIGFAILFVILRRWGRVFHAFKDKKAMKGLILGSIFGPFLGVSFSLIAVKYTQVGIATTLMSLSPIVIIPFSIILFKEKVKISDIIGSVLAITGVALFFI